LSTVKVEFITDDLLLKTAEGNSAEYT
jgi:hypothetical protein